MQSYTSALPHRHIRWATISLTRESIVKNIYCAEDMLIKIKGVIQCQHFPSSGSATAIEDQRHGVDVISHTPCNWESTNATAAKNIKEPGTIAKMCAHSSMREPAKRSKTNAIGGTTWMMMSRGCDFTCNDMNGVSMEAVIRTTWCNTAQKANKQWQLN